MANYRIRHITDYSYEDAASLSYNEAHLLPRSLKTFLYEQWVAEAHIEIEPGWDDYRERVDFYGNRVIYYTVRQPHEHIVVTANSQVRVDARHEAPLGLGIQGNNAMPLLSYAAAWLRENAGQTDAWEQVIKQMYLDQNPITLEARQFCLPSPLIPALDVVAAMAAEHFWPNRPIVEAALSLMNAIFTDFEFMPNATDVSTPMQEVVEKRQGVCQDFAQLMIAALRSQGLAARYMSGYIETLPPPGEEKLEGTDASHAWCALYVPKLGWLDFDPTNNLLPTDQHVILAWGRDFGDVTPIKGVYYGGNHQELNVSVDMKRKEY